MAIQQVIGGAIAHHLLGCNVFAGTVTLSAGSVTIDVSADVTDGREFENAPFVVAIPDAAGEDALSTSTRSTTTITLDDGTGAGTHDVVVIIIEPVGLEPDLGI